MILGIDASTSGSGGAKRHLIELLQNFDVRKHGFEKIIVWGVQRLLDELPNNEFIIKLSHPLLNGNFIKRILWQIFYRDNLIKNKCDVLFSPFGTYIGNISPYVSMSRNMLVFSKTERRRFGFSLNRLKFKLLFFTQRKSFENATGIIFLSNHAKTEIGKYINLDKKNTQIIHHGISQSFDLNPKVQNSINYYNDLNPYNILYVSTIWIYKHPWNVVIAVKNLKDNGYPVSLTIVGNNEQKSAGERLEKVIDEINIKENIISWQQKVGLNEIAEFYKKSDAFIFASTCENMPNILVEAMASGLPITCSSFEPMPEFLKDGGIYFNPEIVLSVENALKKMIDSADLREKLAKKSYSYSKEFSWQKCADKTFDFLYKTSLKK